MMDESKSGDSKDDNVFAKDSTKKLRRSLYAGLGILILTVLPFCVSFFPLKITSAVIVFVLLFGWMLYDSEMIKKAGFDDAPSVVWIIICYPIYFYKRQKIVGENMWPFGFAVTCSLFIFATRVYSRILEP